MSKGFFIDTTLCTACRACQVACKQWHDLPGEITKNNGTFQNPPDLSPVTYKVVRMKEEVIENKLQWLFFPEQCRHCLEPPCLQTAGDPKAIYQDAKTGAVLFSAETKKLDGDAIVQSCPYNIPRKSEEGYLYKCDMCNDRVSNGLLPACVKTCPTGTMNFGELKDMLAMAEDRLKKLTGKYPAAKVLDKDSIRVIYLTVFDPMKYHQNAVATAKPFGINRHMALRRMFRPFTAAIGV